MRSGSLALLFSLVGVAFAVLLAGSSRNARAELTKREGADGFARIFDGHTLDDWLGDTDGYHADDGILVRVRELQSRRRRQKGDR